MFAVQKYGTGTQVSQTLALPFMSWLIKTSFLKNVCFTILVPCVSSQKLCVSCRVSRPQKSRKKSPFAPWPDWHSFLPFSSLPTLSGSANPTVSRPGEAPQSETPSNGMQPCHLVKMAAEILRVALRPLFKAKHPATKVNYLTLHSEAPDSSNRAASTLERFCSACWVAP